MDLKKCDGCGIISPDKKGLHIANSWIEIKYSHGKNDRGIGCVSRKRHAIELCEECFEKIKAVIPAF